MRRGFRRRVMSMGAMTLSVATVLVTGGAAPARAAAAPPHNNFWTGIVEYHMAYAQSTPSVGTQEDIRLRGFVGRNGDAIVEDVHSYEQTSSGCFVRFGIDEEQPSYDPLVVTVQANTAQVGFGSGQSFFLRHNSSGCNGSSSSSDDLMREAGSQNSCAGGAPPQLPAGWDHRNLADNVGCSDSGADYTRSSTFAYRLTLDPDRDADGLSDAQDTCPDTPGSLSSPNGCPSTAAISIALTGLPKPKLNKPYLATLTATGGTSPYTWSVLQGELPAGLSLSDTGTISGVPSQAGVFKFTVAAVDASRAVQTRTYKLTVALAITPASLPKPKVGAAYSQTLTAAGGTAPYSWTQAGGALPPGLGLSSSGVISGTPTTAGTYNFKVSVTDASTPARSGSKAYTVTVMP